MLKVARGVRNGKLTGKQRMQLTVADFSTKAKMLSDRAEQRIS